MQLPEDLEQSVVADCCRVEDHLHRFTVIADRVVVRRRTGPAGVAGEGADDALETPEPGVDAPESARGKKRGAVFGGRSGVGRAGNQGQAEQQAGQVQPSIGCHARAFHISTLAERRERGKVGPLGGRS